MLTGALHAQRCQQGHNRTFTVRSLRASGIRVERVGHQSHPFKPSPENPLPLPRLESSYHNEPLN
jgi:hypothetical protein